MKKRIVLVSMMVMLLLMSACSFNSDSYKQMKESKDYILPIISSEEAEKQLEDGLKSTYEKKDTYQVEKLKIEGLENPAGILCRDKDMLISDHANDKIVLADYTGNIIQEVGITGNGPLEFMSPGEIIEYDNKIYILDEKNFRVQILDEELNYIEEVKLIRADPDNPDFVYQHIAVDSKGIYASGFSFYSDQVHFYATGSTEPILIGKNFIGPIQNYKDNIYAINSYNKVYGKADDTLSFRGSGGNRLLLIDEASRDFLLEEELPQLTSPSSFVIDENNIVMTSKANQSLLIYNREDQSLSRIALMEGFDEEGLYAKGSTDFSSNNEGVYFVTSPVNGIIFKCSLKI